HVAGCERQPWGLASEKAFHYPVSFPKSLFNLRSELIFRRHDQVSSKSSEEDRPLTCQRSCCHHSVSSQEQCRLELLELRRSIVPLRHPASRAARSKHSRRIPMLQPPEIVLHLQCGVDQVQAAHRPHARCRAPGSDL